MKLKILKIEKKYIDSEFEFSTTKKKAERKLDKFIISKFLIQYF